MPLDVSLGGLAIPTTPDNLKDLKADAPLVFHLGQTLQPFLQGALSAVPDTPATSLAYLSPAFTLAPRYGKVSFGLQAGAAGSLDIVNRGDLSTFTEGLESPQVKGIPVPAGLSYVRLSLRFNLSAKGSGRYSGGAFGVKASASVQDTYAMTFCKAFPPSTRVIDAIGQTFESFVLPFHSHTLDAMRDGDFLFHEFDGNLNFAIGAYTGLDQVLYAGQGSADVLKTFGAPLAAISARVQPEIRTSASLDFKLAYETRFEAVLQRAGEAGHLHVFKSDRRAMSSTLAAGLALSMNAQVDVKERVSDHLETLKTSIVSRMRDAQGQAALGAVLDAGSAKLDLQKYADEVTDKLTCWLNRANGVQANLQVAIESTRAKTLLAGYTFPRVNGDGYSAAWEAAIAGDLFAALNTGAVILDPGSGLEMEYQKKTCFHCNFFNLWSVNDWSEFHQKATLIYAGNNTFHFMLETGRSTQTDHVGAMRSIDFYFTARADAAVDGPLKHVDMTLNLAMTAQNDRKGIDRIARMVGAFDASPAMKTVVRDLEAFATKTQNASVHLLVKIPGPAFQYIAADEKSGPHDQANWNVFAQAADNLGAWPLMGASSIPEALRAYFKNYDTWKALSVGESGFGSPDRNRFGAINAWRSDWPAVDSGSRALVIHSMWAGQRYMNFCADLQTLAKVEAGQAVAPTWESLLKLIAKAMDEDTQVDFLAPAALATMRQCRGSTFALAAPASAAIPADHFSIEIGL